MLDSDANLLLLGDGSLICNNCTYSCNACGNKIEDLAILTGDQAFCASCFRCRNCKRKIENLRYARTSQGIFCMSCHESLMARRRKKSKAARQQPAAANGTAPVVLDKSLPALPPSAIPQGAFSPTPEVETPSEQYSETPTERSPSKLRRNGSSRDIKREHSPASLEDSRKGMLRHATGRLPTANETADTLTLPASTYQETRPSHESQRSEPSLNGSGEDGLYVPLALDPNPAPTPSPLARSRKHNENSAEQGSTRPAESKTPGRDYFNNGRLISSTSHRDALKENRQASSRDTSTEREQQHGYTKLSTSPHIAYQEKGRQPSVDLVESIRKRSHTSVPVSPVFSSDKSRSQPGQQALQSDFKLQEAPRSRMSGGSRKNSKSDTLSPSITPTLDSAERSPPSERDVASPDPLEQSWPPPSAQDALNRDGSSGISQISNSSSSHVERPRREDSLPSSSLKQALARKDVGSTGRSSPSTPAPPSGFTHERNASTSSIRANYEDTNALQPNGGRTMSKSARSHSPKSSLDVAPPARSSSRPMPQDTAVSADSFTVPRAPPLPPPPQFDPHHRVNESISTLHSDMSHSMSPVGTLPRYSVGGEFTMEEDMARILRGEEQHEDKPPSVMRKMSNAVARHGRSFSDKGSRATNMHKLRSPLNGSIDISSPTMASPGREEDVILLRNQLRRAQQRIADLETDKNQLQEMVNSSVDIKQVNVELREKRSTMAFLDTQREMVVRELEVMTEHLKRAKESNAPINMQSYKSEIIHDLATSLHKLKDNLGGQIEELTQRKNNLQNEITELIQMKDKGFQEYDSLSTKNTQLTQLNSQLVSNIQGLYQLDKDRHQQHAVSLDGGRPPANGLGIYTHHQKDRSDMSMELRDRIAQDNQFANMMQDPDGAEPTVLNAPQVVNIRKGKPNMWKKGSQAVAKNIKGIKGAFGSDKQDPYRVGHYTTEGVPYGSYTTTSEASTPVSISKNGADPARLGFLNAQKGTAVKGGTAKTMQQNNSNTNVAALDASGKSCTLIFWAFGLMVV